MEDYIGNRFKEKWRPVVIDGETTEYEVSNLAKVRKGDKILTQMSYYTTDKEGKRQEWKNVDLILYGRKKTKKVHRLVAEAWVDNPDGKKRVVKISGDSIEASNLKWADQASIVTSALKGRVPSGEKHWRYGQKATDKTKAAMSKAKSGKSPVGTYVCDGMNFKTAVAAAKHFKISPATVIKRCKAKVKHKEYMAWFIKPKVTNSKK